MEQLTLWSGEPHAKHSVSAESDRDSWIREVSSCSSLSELSTKFAQSGFSGRMFQVAFPKTREEHLAPSSGSWLNAGTLVRGECLTLSLPEYPCEMVTEELPDGSVRCHSAAGASFLSDILERGGGPSAVLFEQESLRGNPKSSKEKREELTTEARDGSDGPDDDGVSREATVAGFCPGVSTTGSITLTDEMSPTLRAQANSNTPAIAIRTANTQQRGGV